ncbi:hypothetical protein [Mucilaginibacter myungsuensis]|uniref:Uncharacterized protein n=1 Tax=Mucilaginibacter myungsuensis TaxID=649104 RepID=A0A929KWJ8_9SPHI|nr:hypothetical protein [Mucilaginibacter myungsuensis]MBE9661768.1 hypothetical protein [Mucilaginibacter myungsuensis]MDN3599798.1 hypothetical protein [Mucilaginibacter myungsuensis]
MIKYSPLVGKKINGESVAVILPVRINEGLTVEKYITNIFDDPEFDRNINNYSDHIVALMFDMQAFLDNGTVKWQHLDDVLATLTQEKLDKLMIDRANEN